MNYLSKYLFWLALLLNSQLSFAANPIKVGELEQINTQINYLQESSFTKTISYPGASYIKLHVSKAVLAAGDSVTISSPDNKQVYTYPGAGFTTDSFGGFWALSIIGDTAIIELHRTPQPLDNLNNFGIVIDKVARGLPKHEVEALITESTCGTNERTDVACYQNSHPTEFNKSNAVARLLINNTSLCTAWRVSPNNYMFTNEHCITSQADVNATEVWFNYQLATCGSGNANTTTIVTGEQLFVDDTTLDFALFSVKNFASIQSFGFLELDARTPVLNEEIYIPQHGAGNPKEFGIESDQNTGNVCRIDIATINNDTGYKCDTTGGSSGSPVLARSSNKVIALHHLGGCNNQGVLIEKIQPLVKTYLDTNKKDILLVDDDNNIPDARSYYTDSLNELNISYKIWDTQNSDNEPDQNALSAYKTVMWFTGNNFSASSGPGSVAENSLGAWLNGEDIQCFMISSQDYHWARKKTQFMQDYLGVNSIVDDVSQTTVTGSGSIFNGIASLTLTSPFANYTDTISAQGNAEVAFVGNIGDAAVNKNNSSYLTAFLGFPLEALSNNDRKTIMQKFLDKCQQTTTPSPGGIIKLENSTYSINETGTSVTIKVIRSGGSKGVASVDYTSIDNTAKSANDYNAVSGTLNWNDGDNSEKTITIVINDDNQPEGDENFRVEISNPKVAILGTPKTATINIKDNDPATLTSKITPIGGGTINLTANPKPGFVFKQWSGDCSGTNSQITIPMNTNMNCIANFEVSP